MSIKTYLTIPNWRKSLAFASMLALMAPSALAQSELRLEFSPTILGDNTRDIANQVEGKTFKLKLSAINIFSDDFKLLEQKSKNKNGNPDYKDITQQVSKPKTYVGSVEGMSGAIIFGIKEKDGDFRGRIFLDRDITWDLFIPASGKDHRIARGTSNPLVKQFRPSTIGVVTPDQQVDKKTYSWDLIIDTDAGFYEHIAEDVIPVLETKPKGVDGIFESAAFAVLHATVLGSRDLQFYPKLKALVIRPHRKVQHYKEGDSTSLKQDLRHLWSLPQLSDISWDQAAIAAWDGGSGTNTGRVSELRVRQDKKAGQLLHGMIGALDHEVAGHGFNLGHFVGGGPDGGNVMGGAGPVTRWSVAEVKEHKKKTQSQKGNLYPIAPIKFEVPPYAAMDQYTYTRNEDTFDLNGLTMDVLANDTDGNGDSISLKKVDSVSNRGVKIRQVGDRIVYEAKDFGVGTDFFKYVIEDSTGRTATGVVTVIINAKETQILQAEDRTSGERLSEDSFTGEDHIAFPFPGNHVAWDVDVPEADDYMIKVSNRTWGEDRGCWLPKRFKPVEVRVSVNGKALDQDVKFFHQGKWTYLPIPNINLKKGTNTLRFERITDVFATTRSKPLANGKCDFIITKGPKNVLIDNIMVVGGTDLRVNFGFSPHKGTEKLKEDPNHFLKIKHRPVSHYMEDLGDKFAVNDKYGGGISYGWNQDITKNFIDNITDKSTNEGLEHMRTGLMAMKNGQRYTWEMKLPNGRYIVNLGAGDVENKNAANNEFEIEGVVLEDPDPKAFNIGQVIVNVKDGRLTIRPSSQATDAVLAFVEVSDFISENPMPTPPSNDDDPADDNTGDDNTGDDNTGDDNTGDDNTGDDNTGDDNTDDDNTGDEAVIDTSLVQIEDKKGKNRLVIINGDVDFESKKGGASVWRIIPADGKWVYIENQETRQRLAVTSSRLNLVSNNDTSQNAQWQLHDLARNQTSISHRETGLWIKGKSKGIALVRYPSGQGTKWVLSTP